MASKYSCLADYTINALVRRKDVDQCARDEVEEEVPTPSDTPTSINHTNEDDPTQPLTKDQTGSPSPSSSPKPAKLKRHMAFRDVLAYGVAAVVGAGIYSVIGSASQIAGPAISISFLIGALAGLLTGLAYAEFASRVPAAGSAYTYTYATFGELVAFV